MALKGVKVLELAGLAPTPFAGMILADFGAHVIRVDRVRGPTMDTMGRGKRSIGVNLKSPEGSAVIRRLSKTVDVLIEPFRPGIMEKLGLGPDTVSKENPGLIYVRLSGFGQTGPYKFKAGHDINYIATSGVLSKLRRKGQNPTAPMNIIADFAGGGLLAAFGVVTALYERQRSGKGQVIDMSMVDGSAYVASFLFTSQRLFPHKAGENLLDTGAPFYDTYRTKDDQYVSVGAIEPQFFDNLIKGLNLDKDNDLPNQMDRSKWPLLRSKIEQAIASRTREELSNLFENDDSCVMPVLSQLEASMDPHNKENNTFFRDPDGQYIPNPAPKLSRTPGIADSGPQPIVGGHTTEVLLENGFDKNEIKRLVMDGAVADNSLKSKI